MKNYCQKFKITAMLLCLGLLIPHVGIAKSTRFKNKVRLAETKAEILLRLDRIPIHKEKLTGDYQLIGLVSSQDALTSKKTFILRDMRFKAYKVGADAIMEFNCRQIGKSFLQRCEGFAIKYK